MLALFLMRSGLWRWGAWLGSYRAKCVYEVGRVALIEVRVVFGLQNHRKTSLENINDVIRLQVVKFIE